MRFQQRAVAFGLVAVALGCGCAEPGTDEAAFATYYVVNETAGPVLFKAERLRSGESLSVEVAPAQAAEVDRVSEGSGGHVYPSNFYESYTLESGGKVATRRYQNSDWASCSSEVPDEAERVELCLHVTAGDFE